MTDRSASPARLGWGEAGLAGAVVLVTAAGAPEGASRPEFGPLATLGLVPAAAVVGLVPGVLAARFVAPGEPWSRAGLAVLLSALAAFALGSACLAFGLAFVWAARGLALLALGSGIAAWLRVGRPGPIGRTVGARAHPSPAAGVGGRRAAAVGIAAWLLVLAAIWTLNPELRYRVDGWFHGAVAARLAQVGAPPDDPFFAGQKLLYPWAYHVVLDVTSAAGPAGTTPFDALVSWSLLSALAVGSLAVSLGSAWAEASGLDATAGARAGGWALALAVLGYNPLGWVFPAGGALFGRDRGLGVLARPLSEGAAQTLGTLSPGFPHPSLASFADKFLTPTAFGLGYAAFLAVLLVLFFGDPGASPGASASPAGLRSFAGPRRLLLVALVVAAGLVFHGLVAVALLACLAVWGALAAGSAAGRRRLALTAGAVGLALLFVGPYLVAIQAGRSSDAGPTLGVHADMVWGMAVAGVLYFTLGGPEVWRGVVAGGPRRDLAVVLLVLLALALGVGLFQRNETKFANLLFLGLAIPAGTVLARKARSTAALLLLLVPTNAFAYAGFLFDPGHDRLGLRLPPPELRQAYVWVGAHTPRMAVFLEAEAPGAREADCDLLVHGPRPLVWGGLAYASNWGYSPSALAPRRRAASELGSTGLTAASYAYLESTFERRGRPVYAVVRRETAPAPAGVSPPGSGFLPGGPGGGPWALAFANSALRLYRMADSPERP